MNTYQKFALQYQIRRRREQLVVDIDETLQKQTYYQHPDRYRDLFFEPYGESGIEPLTLGGRPVEEVVDDLDEVDAYFDGLDDQRMVTGEEVFDVLSDDGGWI